MIQNKYKILIVEDEANIRNLIATMLETEGYYTMFADTVSAAKTLFKSHRPEVVILDLGLPDMDGMNFIDFARTDSLTPIIVLSARSNEGDKILALDKGANDYITKPFSSGELLARVRVALRNNRFSSDEGRLPGGRFTLKDLEIDYDARQVYINKKEIHLTQTEYNIVAFLSENSGKMMTYSTIIKEIWGEYAWESNIKKLQVNMANIRKKFGDKPGEVNYIANELGVGYRLNEQ